MATVLRGVALLHLCLPATSLPAPPPAGLRTLPAITLQRGEFYFRVDGTPSFLLGRNPAGRQPEQFRTLLQWAADSGERIVRIHLTGGVRPAARPGDVDEAWARWWEEVFDGAAQNGLYVLPVFSVWADWNDGSRGENWHSWPRNPYNAALGGPAERPSDLFRDTPARKLWFAWLGKLITRWRDRPNILGWEVFSEADLVTGSAEETATGFIEQAAGVIRGRDHRRRPVTASLAGTRHWPRLFKSDALDFIQVHPYANFAPFLGNLDDLILSCVRDRLRQYGKPVLIGESGLDARPLGNTLSTSPRAEVGIRHAIWASAVSGAMSGRMLWWEDRHPPRQEFDLHIRYKSASAPVARFIRDVDYSNFQPVEIRTSEEVKGAAVGRNDLVIGWLRDRDCSAPDWPLRNLKGRSVTVAAPGDAVAWQIEFYDTQSGAPAGTAPGRRQTGGISFALPAWQGSIAFKLRALAR